MSQERLWRMLPALYRLRDDDGALRALLSILESELETVEGDIDRLYDDWFIETCRPERVSAIGAWLGIDADTLHEHPDLDHRSLVANALAYRRRKGTVPMIERVVRDVTGWTARLVEYRDRIGRTQHLARPRPELGGFFALDQDPSAAAHTVDIHTFDGRRGLYNPTRVALHVWRLRPNPVVRSPAVPVGPGCFLLHPLGVESSLLHHPAPPPPLDAADPRVEIPAPLRRAELPAQLAREDALAVWLDGARVDPARVVAADLGAWWESPEPGLVYIDPERGRLQAPGASVVAVSCAFGAVGAFGGGSYFLDVPRPRADALRLRVTEPDGLAAALTRWRDSGLSHAHVELAGCGGYTLPSLEIPSGMSLVLTALEGGAPVLHAASKTTVDGPGHLALHGLAMRTTLEVRGGATLRLGHCTLLADEGAPALTAAALDDGHARDITIAACVLGAIEVPDRAVSLSDALVLSGPLPAITARVLAAERCTFTGACAAEGLGRVADCLFVQPLSVRRTATSLVESSYLAPGSRVLRRVRCQPDLALAAAPSEGARAEVLRRVVPHFTSLRYGNPACGQLASATPLELRHGALDGSEMGFTCSLRQPQRELNLRAILDEHLRFGIEAGLVFST